MAGVNVSMWISNIAPYFAASFFQFAREWLVYAGAVLRVWW